MSGEAISAETKRRRCLPMFLLSPCCATTLRDLLRRARQNSGAARCGSHDISLKYVALLLYLNKKSGLV